MLASETCTPHTVDQTHYRSCYRSGVRSVSHRKSKKGLTITSITKITVLHRKIPKRFNKTHQVCSSLGCKRSEFCDLKTVFLTVFVQFFIPDRCRSYLSLLHVSDFQNKRVIFNSQGLKQQNVILFRMFICSFSLLTSQGNATLVKKRALSAGVSGGEKKRSFLR